MATRFSKKVESDNSINLGYENSGGIAEKFFIPSCGIEDLDRSVFNLFDKEIPLYYKINNERKKVPVIFAAGERFAIARRQNPITDSNGNNILPLISISRSSIDAGMSNSKLANNEMYPLELKRIHRKSAEEKILNNREGFKNVSYANESIGININLNPEISGNIIETIQLPPVKSFNAKYEIVIWSSYTSQINKFLETIMSSYTMNPSNSVRLDTDKGYWFVGKFDSSFSQDANYNEFTDKERFIKQTMSLTASGYIINPDIEGYAQVRSYQSSNNVSFDFYSNYDKMKTLW